MAWMPRLAQDDYYASLPFFESQRVLAEGVASVGAAVRGTCGWHGTNFDPHRGAVAIANTDGVFADFTGERVRLTYYHDPLAPRTIIVYVYDEALPLDDLSLPRPIFARLAPLAYENITVSAEVLA